MIDDRKNTFQHGLCAKPTQKYALPKAGKIGGLVIIDFETGSGDFDLVDTGVVLEQPKDTTAQTNNVQLQQSFFNAFFPVNFMVPLPQVPIRTSVMPSKRKLRGQSEGKRSKKKKDE